MKLPKFVPPYSNDLKNLTTHLVDYFRDLTVKVNGLASGSYNAIDNAMTAAPTAGTWTQNDFVHNSSISELGAPGTKYTVRGWRCVVGGTPGTWVQERAATGN